MTTYQQTLASSRWFLLKQRVMRRAGFRCQGCGRRYHGPRQHAHRHFNLHHRHYNSVGAETFDDVTLLCRICHKLEHGLVA